MEGDTVTARELGGEIFCELDHEFSGEPADSADPADLAGWRAIGKIVDLVTAVLARHDHELLVNDPDLPVTPLPYVFGEYQQVQLLHDYPSAGLKKRAEGTIVRVHPSGPGRCEVAFRGRNGAEFTVALDDTDIERVRPASRARTEAPDE